MSQHLVPFGPDLGSGMQGYANGYHHMIHYFPAVSPETDELGNLINKLGADKPRFRFAPGSGNSQPHSRSQLCLYHGAV